MTRTLTISSIAPLAFAGFFAAMVLFAGATSASAEAEYKDQYMQQLHALQAQWDKKCDEGGLKTDVDRRKCLTQLKTELKDLEERKAHLTKRVATLERILGIGTPDKPNPGTNDFRIIRPDGGVVNVGQPDRNVKIHWIDRVGAEKVTIRLHQREKTTVLANNIKPTPSEPVGCARIMLNKMGTSTGCERPVQGSGYNFTWKNAARGTDYWISITGTKGSTTLQAKTAKFEVRTGKKEFMVLSPNGGKVELPSNGQATGKVNITWTDGYGVDKVTIKVRQGTKTTVLATDVEGEHVEGTKYRYVWDNAKLGSNYKVIVSGRVSTSTTVSDASDQPFSIVKDDGKANTNETTDGTKTIFGTVLGATTTSEGEINAALDELSSALDELAAALTSE